MSHFDIRASLRSEAMAAAASAMAGATAAAASATAGATDSTDAAATALASMSLSSSSSSSSSSPSASSSAAPTPSKVEALERLFVRHWDDFCVQAAEQFRLKEVCGFEFSIYLASCSPSFPRANCIESILLETIVLRF